MSGGKGKSGRPSHFREIPTQTSTKFTVFRETVWSWVTTCYGWCLPNEIRNDSDFYERKPLPSSRPVRKAPTSARQSRIKSSNAKAATEPKAASASRRPGLEAVPESTRALNSSRVSAAKSNIVDAKWSSPRTDALQGEKASSPTLQVPPILVPPKDPSGPRSESPKDLKATATATEENRKVKVRPPKHVPRRDRDTPHERRRGKSPKKRSPRSPRRGSPVRKPAPKHGARKERPPPEDKLPKRIEDMSEGTRKKLSFGEETVTVMSPEAKLVPPFERERLSKQQMVALRRLAERNRLYQKRYGKPLPEEYVTSTPPELKDALNAVEESHTRARKERKELNQKLGRVKGRETRLTEKADGKPDSGISQPVGSRRAVDPPYRIDRINILSWNSRRLWRKSRRLRSKRSDGEKLPPAPICRKKDRRKDRSNVKRWMFEQIFSYPKGPTEFINIFVVAPPNSRYWVAYCWSLVDRLIDLRRREFGEMQLNPSRSSRRGVIRDL